MAKSSQIGSERSKVRIFFVEGDFAPGDLRELTQALTSAIRPAPLLGRNALGTRSGVSTGITALNTNGAADDIEAQAQAGAEDVEDDAADEAPHVPKGPAKIRHYRRPQPVDMDMGAGGKPFRDFAAEKSPTAHRSKYLVAAAWLYDCAKIGDVTADHIFTCYKTADWPFDVSDPTVTFRQLKKEGLGSLKRGTFSINHLGVAEVQKMKVTA